MPLVPQSLGRSLFLLCVTALPSLGFAELTAQEKQQVIHQIESMNLLASAAGEMMGHLDEHPEDAKQVRGIVKSLVGARRSARARQFGALLELASGDGIGGRGRRRALRRAFRELDRADVYMARSEKGLLRLQSRCEARCTHLDDALFFLRESQAIHVTFDATLPFAHPKRDGTLSSFEAVAREGYDELQRRLEGLSSTDEELRRGWARSVRAAIGDPGLAGSVATEGMTYMMKLWQVAAAFGLAVGAEHPSVAPHVDDVLAGTLEVDRTAAQITVSNELLRRVTLEDVDSGASSPNGESTATSGVAVASADSAESSTSSLVAPSFSLTAGGVYDALASYLPAPGEFTLLPGSPIDDVLVQDGEFPFCDEIGCQKAKNAFLAWIGMAFDPSLGRWWNPAGGGHADYGGNEIYQYDFRTLAWERLTDPMPLTGPFQTDTDDDGTMDACPAPASGPPATHTYDGSIYVPSRNEVLILPSSPFCRGAMGQAQAAWVWSNASSTWRKLASVESTVYMRTAYDPARDRVYLIGGQGSGTFYELDPQKDYALVREGPYLGWLRTGVAEFDESTRFLYYSGAKIGIFRVYVGLDGTLGSPEQIVSWKGKENLAVTIHRPTGHLVTWAGDGEVMRIDPSTGRTWDVTPVSGPLPSSPTNKIYSKWVYIEAVDAFAGIVDARDGIWVYRLPGASESLPDPGSKPEPEAPGPNPNDPPEAAPSDPQESDPNDPPETDPSDPQEPSPTNPEEPAPPPPSPPDPSPEPTPPIDSASFEERCNADGVVLCDPLDTEGPWGVDASGRRRLMANPDGSTGIPTETWWRQWRGVSQKNLDRPGHVLPRLDTAVKASGTGSLKLDYPGFSLASGGGTFATNFSDDLSQQFGEGDTFYVQYRWRADCDFLYFDCDPTSPTYKTERRYFANQGGGQTAFKLSIIADGDPALGESADACTWLQIVTVHGPDHYLSGFHSCGWYEGFSERTGEGFFGSKQIDFQPNGNVLGAGDDVSPTCWRIPEPDVSGRKREWGFTGPDCWYLDSDEWITIQVMLRVGTWQPDREGEPNSHVTIWAAHEGEAQRVIVDHDLYLRGPRTPGRKYGKVWLMPFMTKKDDSEDHPTGHIWFDELIVSTQFIADPR